MQSFIQYNRGSRLRHKAWPPARRERKATNETTARTTVLIETAKDRKWRQNNVNEQHFPFRFCASPTGSFNDYDGKRLSLTCGSRHGAAVGWKLASLHDVWSSRPITWHHACHLLKNVWKAFATFDYVSPHQHSSSVFCVVCLLCLILLQQSRNGFGRNRKPVTLESAL